MMKMMMMPGFIIFISLPFFNHRDWWLSCSCSWRRIMLMAINRKKLTLSMESYCWLIVIFSIVSERISTLVFRAHLPQTFPQISVFILKRKDNIGPLSICFQVQRRIMLVHGVVMLTFAGKITKLTFNFVSSVHFKMTAHRHCPLPHA